MTCRWPSGVSLAYRSFAAWRALVGGQDPGCLHLMCIHGSGLHRMRIHGSGLHRMCIHGSGLHLMCIYG
ncbi:MAG TPA: hypothetical protein VFM38_05540, partial [Candidatus Limnocylindrales bacterium]|nr:hypothetical protein [Candidatus Limnocylindrales bacterium]